MKYKTSVFALALSLTVMAAPARAAAELVPVGTTVGIELQCRGVVVTGFAEVQTRSGVCCPAKEAGLLPGDAIVAVDGESVSDGGEFLERTTACAGAPMRLRVLRDRQELEIKVTPAENAEGRRQLGLWLRDSVHGIGTVTFYDPATGAYGALGHGVSLPGGGELLDISGGCITAAGVEDVVPGQRGEPGELRGVPDGEQVLGTVEANTAQGIFGTAREPLGGGTALPVAEDREIRTGSARIVTTVDGEGPREFDAEIVRVDLSAADARQLTISITDPELLDATGGIVQGMSGSPVVQDGKLVGAVTHVLLNDPSKGYAVSMENMLSARPELQSAA